MSVEVKKGQRVRVVLEGEVTWASTATGAFEMDQHLIYSGAPGVSIEVLPEPVPEFEAGDVAIVPYWYPFVRSGYESWLNNSPPQAEINRLVRAAHKNGTLKILRYDDIKP